MRLLSFVTGMGALLLPSIVLTVNLPAQPGCNSPPPYSGPTGLVQPGALPTPTPSPQPTPSATPIPSGASSSPRPTGAGGAYLTRRRRWKEPPTYDHWVFWWHKNKDAYLGQEPRQASSEGDEFVGQRRRVADTPMTETVYRTLIARLQDPYSEVRADACVALGRAMCGTKWSERTAKALLARLDDSVHEVHEAVIVGLGFLRDREAIGWLRALLENHPDTRLLLKTRRPCFCLRSLAAFALGMIGELPGDTGTRDFLVEQATRSDVNHNIAKMAMLGIGMLEGDRVYLAPAFVPLRDIAADPKANASARAHAVISIARLLNRNHLVPGGDTLDQLSELMQRDKSLLVRLSSIIALGTLLDVESHEDRIAELRTKLERGVASERNLAAIALARIGGGKSFRSLLKYVSRGNDQRTAYAALGLGIMCRRWKVTGSEAEQRHRQIGLKALRRALEKKRAPGLRGAMAIAVGIARDDRAVKGLEKLLAKHRDDEERGYAAIALGMVGEKKAVPSLKKTLDEKRVTGKILRAHIEMGLALLGDRSTLDDLIGAYEAPLYAAELSAMAETMSFLADGSTVKKLRNLAIDKKQHAFARGAACLALGAAADQRRRHPRSLINIAGNYIASFHTWNVVNFHTY